MMQEFTGKHYLKIDVANSFAKDKLNWDERIKWFDENISSLDPKEAEEPCMAYAGIKAFKDAEKGKPSGYPISLDATCSGMAWLSILVQDVGGCTLTNVIDSGQRIDAYTTVFNTVKAKLPNLRGVSRTEAKDAVMTSLYSSIVEPEKIFGSDVDVFYQTMYELMPRTWSLNSFMLDIWDPKVTEHRWIMPDGFDVITPVYRNSEYSFDFLDQTYTYTKKEVGTKKRGRSLCANLAHSVDSLAVRELVRRCSYDPETYNRAVDTLFGSKAYRGTKKEYELAERLALLYRTTGFLSMRVLDCLNYNTVNMFPHKELCLLLKSLPKKPFSVLTIHDAFRVLPNYGNDLRKQYREVCIQVGNSGLLNWILFSMREGASFQVGENITNKFGCDYAIC